jgi:hypothetical protein
MKREARLFSLSLNNVKTEVNVKLGTAPFDFKGAGFDFFHSGFLYEHKPPFCMVSLFCIERNANFADGLWLGFFSPLATSSPGPHEIFQHMSEYFCVVAQHAAPELSKVAPISAASRHFRHESARFAVAHQLLGGLSRRLWLL